MKILIGLKRVLDFIKLTERKWIWVGIFILAFAGLFADVVILNLKLAGLDKRLKTAESLLSSFAQGRLPLIQTGEKSFQPIIPLIWQNIEDLRLRVGASQSSDKFELPQ